VHDTDEAFLTEATQRFADWRPTNVEPTRYLEFHKLHPRAVDPGKNLFLETRIRVVADGTFH
jgi:hypothetical protein